MFDINVIPPSNRNKAAIAAHLELYNRSMDTVRVHNPSDTDFIVHNDKRVSNEKYVIPAQTKDIGYGKGNNDVPRFIAKRYLDTMGIEMINVKIKEDWLKKKGKFRLEEQGMMEERLALRSSDPKLWDEITPKLWVKVVKRYQEETYDEPEPIEARKEYSSPADEALDRLGLTDSDIDTLDTNTETDKKDEFINQVV